MVDGRVSKIIRVLVLGLVMSLGKLQKKIRKVGKIVEIVGTLL